MNAQSLSSVDPARSIESDGYALAVDVGGTFVDLTLCDLSSGTRWVKKVLSDKGPQAAFITGVRQVCADAGIETGAISRVVHGMTLATNAILELSNPEAAVVTTEGFADVLEIGRHDAPRGANNLGWLKQRRPIGRDRIVEVKERVAWDGEVLLPLSEEAMARTVERLKALKPTAVAISLLHGYHAPAHEAELLKRLRQDLAGVHVTASHEVLTQSGEYERLMATVLNAYTMPAVTDYLAALEAELKAIGVLAPLYIMSSDGGVLSSTDAKRLPITTALSGPAGGAAGAAGFAEALGEPRIFTLDVGGTSSDVAAAEAGNVDMTVGGGIGVFPLALPALDVHTVGAGGGSLARVRSGRFTVGPESAGARPGPVCYGRGGQEPTVTDALFVMGWLPDQLAGGALRLDMAAARHAIQVHVAEPLGMDIIAAATGIVRMANAHMAAAIRHMSTERGRDPRDYALLPFGGAGGLHAVEVAKQVGVPRVVVPPAPGVFTTEGLLAADLSRHYVHSFVEPMTLDAIDPAALGPIFERLDAQAMQWLGSGAATLNTRLTRAFDLRYVNQGYELIVSLSGETVDAETLAKAAIDFHDAFETRYRYRLPDVGIELVRARVEANGLLAHAGRGKAAKGATGADQRFREIYFEQDGWRDTPIVERSTLAPGEVVHGPAVVQEYDSTTVLPPGASASVADNGALVITYERTTEGARAHG